MADRLLPGHKLATNGSLESANGQYKVTMQRDGNLVLYSKAADKAIWASHTYNTSVDHAIMQEDGNFVLYRVDGRPEWASHTSKPGSFIVMQDDGNLVIYQPTNPIWASHTAQS